MKSNFENYKTIHEFVYRETLKSWIDETNYRDFWLTDWNALMELVEQIQTIEDHNYCVTIDQNVCRIWSEDGTYEEELVYYSTIEAVYKSCLEFIKWYNSKTN